MEINILKNVEQININTKKFTQLQIIFLILRHFKGVQKTANTLKANCLKQKFVNKDQEKISHFGMGFKCVFD